MTNNHSQGGGLQVQKQQVIHSPLNGYLVHKKLNP